MSKQKDGEAVVFPGVINDADSCEVEIPMMSLRDYFAAAYISALGPMLCDGDLEHRRAEYAYAQADALLTERERKTDE